MTKPSFSDVNKVDAKLKDFVYGKNVLNLRPSFRSRRPWLWVSAIIVLAIGGFLLARNIFIRADVNDFYASTCLGNWQNPANAEGEPETLAAASTSFSADNSAVYVSGTQIFCGGFLPPATATSGVITNVGLTLVWQVGDAPSSTQVSSTSSPALNDISASTTAGAGAPAPANSTTTPDSETASSSTSLGSFHMLLSRIIPFAFADDASGTSGASDTIDVGSADAPADTTTVSEATTSDTVQPDGAATTTTPATSTATATTTAILEPPLITDLVSSTASSTPPAVGSATDTTTTAITETTTTATGTAAATGTMDATTTGAPADMPIAQAPPLPDGNFLSVSYSTDGETWINVGMVNINNWQAFTVTVPVSDWADLENLQIRVEGIPTTQDPVPPVYLDGMLMEVHYDVPSLTPPPDETPTSTDPSAPPVRVTLLDPGAAQTCSAEPFSQPLPPGGTAEFAIRLHPSINGVSYDLFAGHLPAGITAAISDPAGNIAATSSILFHAAPDAQTGSFNVQIIYHEQEANGMVLSNFCQLNIDVR